MAAPSAVNQQPWEFYVVTDKAVLEKLAAASPYAAMTAKAPAAIVLCSRTENILVPELYESYWNNRRICSAIGGMPLKVKLENYYDSLQAVA